jgi:hypothetical protein
LIFLTSGFHRFLRRSQPVLRQTSNARLLGANHGSIGDSWPIAFSGCPRGTRVGCETKPARGMQSLTNQLRLALEPECLKKNSPPRKEIPAMERIRSRHSSCLCFQMFGVEAHSFLPNNQRNGCNLPRQGQTRHLRTDPLGHQRSVKLLKRTGLGRGHGCSTLE